MVDMGAGAYGAGDLYKQKHDWTDEQNRLKEFDIAQSKRTYRK